MYYVTVIPFLVIAIERIFLVYGNFIWQQKLD